MSEHIDRRGLPESAARTVATAELAMFGGVGEASRPPHSQESAATKSEFANGIVDVDK